MKLHDVLYALCFMCGLTGVMGLGGCIEFGEGWVASICFLVMSGIFGYFGRKEEGVRR